MSAEPYSAELDHSASGHHPGPDTREFKWIRAGDIIVDQRTQRECAQEKIDRIANELSWPRFETPSVTRSRERGDKYVVCEGQHRVLAVQQIDPDMLVGCRVIDLDDVPEPEAIATQAQYALDIVKGRSAHGAYQEWRLRYNAGHPHEVHATEVLNSLGLRVGNKVSAASISACGTVTSIIHGGSLTPEQGAELLRRTLSTVIAAFPMHDHESSTNRWNCHLLHAISSIYVNYPDTDADRLALCISRRVAAQWINLGKEGTREKPHVTMARHIASEYNRGKRAGRIWES